MKVKHWQGYGSVNAVRAKNDKEGCVLHIVVTGEHECGLVRDDMYDVYRWLVKRFDKTVPEELEWERNTRMEIDEVEWNECHYRFFKKNSWGW